MKLLLKTIYHVPSVRLHKTRITGDLAEMREFITPRNISGSHFTGVGDCGE